MKMPVVREVDAAMVEANFQRVKRAIEEMVITETDRIEGDAVLRKKMVKR
jgi:predicted phage-related endonuclease